MMTTSVAFSHDCWEVVGSWIKRWFSVSVGYFFSQVGFVSCLLHCDKAFLIDRLTITAKCVFVNLTEIYMPLRKCGTSVGEHRVSRSMTSADRSTGVFAVFRGILTVISSSVLELPIACRKNASKTIPIKHTFS
jgi:hypothetical protein